MNDSHYLVPQIIIDNFKTGEYHGSFSAVGMFVDLSGFSTITDTLMEHGQHGAEVLAFIMRDIFTPLIQSVYEQDGFITTIAGDAFTALFQIKDDRALVTRQAFKSAWDIQQYMEVHSVLETQYGDFNVSVKIGMAQGEVEWGILRSENDRRAVYYFRGSAIDGCSLAEQKANAGDIVLEADLKHEIEKVAKTEKFGDHLILAELKDDFQPRASIERPIIEPQVMSLFYPEILLNRYQSSDFRQVINMFINLPTVRTEVQLEIFMRSLFDLQEQFGGIISRLDFGDKGSNLLLIWGAPISYENDLTNALDLILELQTNTSMPISAGITYQIAHTGFVGSPLREEYTNYGRGVNLAARLMTAAPRGDIWIDEHIYKRTNKSYEIEFEGEISFKGFSNKQKVYSLFERKESAGSIFQGQMIGRQAEKESLEKFLSPLKNGKYCGALVVWGEPGIGKSRLVYEVNRSSTLGDHDVLWANCQSDQTLHESLNPFSYWLYKYFGVSKNQIEARNKRNFNRKLESLISVVEVENLGSALDRNRSFLAALVGLHWPDSLFEQLDAQSRYDNTFIALIDLFRAESLIQPIVIYLEDAQWLDEDSRLFLPMLGRTLTSEISKSYPVAIIATARREFQDPLLGKGLDYHEIKLGALSDESLTQLAELILGDRADDELLDLVSKRAEGNPFFAEQILIYLQEEDLLEKIGDTWIVKKGAGDPLPDDVRSVLVSRLDRLTLEVKNVVQTAAVLGREFEVNLLALMLRGDDKLPEMVKAAEQAAIWTAMNEIRYIFNHALLHETAYHMQLRARRELLHKLAIEALEELYSEDLSSHYPELAYHCERAKDSIKAQFYLLKAGDAAREVYQNIQALDYYSRSLDLLPAENLESRFDVLLSIESIHRLFGHVDFQESTLKTLSLIVESSSSEKEREKWIRRKAELLNRWADYYITTASYQEAIKSAEQAVSLAHKSDSLIFAVQGNLYISTANLRQGNISQAYQWAEIGLQLAQDIGDQRGESHSLNSLGMLSLENHNLSQAHQYFTGCLNIARETGNLRDQAMPLNNLGIVSGVEGEYIAAQKYYEQALAISREIGDRGGEGIVLGNLGWIASTQGDYLIAQDYLQQQLQISRQVGDRQTEAFALVNLSFLTGALGDYEASLDFANKSLNISQDIGDRSIEAWSLTCLGNSNLEIRDLNKAQKAYHQALRIRDSLSQPNLSTEPLAGLARVALLNEDIPEALNYIEKIVSFLENGGSLEGTEEPLRVYLTCYQVFQAANDPRSAAFLDDAYKLLQTQTANWTDESSMKVMIKNVPYKQEILSAWKERHQPD